MRLCDVRFLWRLVVPLAVAGCDLSETIDDIVADASSAALDQAFADVAASAAQSGGGALRLSGGSGGTLYIDAATSPIRGTKVTIPDGAIATGVEAVLVVVPQPDFELADTTYAAVGPAVDVRLQSLPDLDPVALAKSAVAQVPLFPADATTVTDAAVGHIGDDGAVTPLAAAAADTGTVAGYTSAFSRFLAVHPAPSPRAPLFTYSYVVRQGSTVLCEESGSVAAGAGESEMWLVFSDDLETQDVQATVRPNGVGEMFLFGRPLTSPVEPADVPLAITASSFAIVPPSVAPWMDLSIDCGGTTGRAFNYTGANVTRATLEILEFLTESSAAASDCGSTNSLSCTRHLGTAWIVLDMAFTDSNDSTISGEATFDGTIAGVRWETAP